SGSSWYGAEPPGAVLSARDLIALGLAIMPATLPRFGTSEGSGADSLSTAVVGSTTRTLAMPLSLPAASLAPVFVLSMFALTAAASNAVPSVNLTPVRSFSVSCVCDLSYFHDVAQFGVGARFERGRTREAS